MELVAESPKMLVFSCFTIYRNKWGAHNKPFPNCNVMIDIILLHSMASAVDQADGSSPIRGKGPPEVAARMANRTTLAYLIYRNNSSIYSICN